MLIISRVIEYERSQRVNLIQSSGKDGLRGSSGGKEIGGGKEEEEVGARNVVFFKDMNRGIASILNEIFYSSLGAEENKTHYSLKISESPSVTSRKIELLLLAVIYV